jgi:nucleoside-diphosphate kinase
MLEMTLGIVKPNAVADRHVGEIISMAEKAGFEIVGMKLLRLKKSDAESFYDVHKGKPFFDELVEFISSGPIVVFVLKKERAVEEWRKLLGNTDPAKAEDGTVRKLFGENIGRNAAHGSDSPENAKREISFFFSEISLV